jgi:gamma-glutamyltranspeptidase/glutathione hydrolase
MIKFFLTKLLLLIISTCLFSSCYLLPVLVKDEPKKIGSWNHGAMVSAANPYAVEAAIEILEKGGSAVDAAIAAHAVLGLVEPQSSGLGGGGFLLHYNYDDNNLTFIDGRETAPGSATFDMFMKDDGNVMDFLEAWPSGKAVGTPGIVALYSTAHATHGVLPWSELFNHAITLAENGFIVSPRLVDFLVLAKKRGRLAINSRTKKYFYPDEEPLQKGDLLNNPEYANTLIRIAKEGASAFYTGPIADAIVAAVQEGPNPGGLTLSDLRNYKTIIRPVICGPFRDMNICTTSPPSSGGALIMIAGLYDHLVKTKASQADKVLALVDAQRLAYADRDHYFGDPDEVAIPLDALLNPTYLKHRASERFDPNGIPTPGNPASIIDTLGSVPIWGKDNTQEEAGTTHLSIVDGNGNAVAMTATIESAFGSQRWAAGFLLNNEMTDFAREVPADGTRLANAVAPNRRPRSSMSPTMIFDQNNQLLMITGSPGGNSIPAYVAKTIIGVFDWGLTAQQSVDWPNIIARGEKVRVEIANDEGKVIAADLTKRGYQVEESLGESSGIHLIIVTPKGLDGAADKRREGVVRTID